MDTLTETQTAFASAQLDAAATTGGNSSSQADLATISTGNAEAAGESYSELNTTAADNPEVSPTPIPTPTPTPTDPPAESATKPPQETAPTPSLSTPETPAPLASLTGDEPGAVGSAQLKEAILEVTATTTASSGLNSGSENGTLIIQTGNATALVNVFNITNTTSSGSVLRLVTIDLLANQDGDMDLNLLWDNILRLDEGGQLLLQDGGCLCSPGTDAILASSRISNRVSVTAISGGNSGSDNGSVSMTTGDSIALANLANIANTTLIDSKFLFGYVNILSDYKGNLILPRPEKFKGIVAGQGNYVTQPAHFSAATSEIFSFADSGTNSADGTSGNNLMTTGESTAVSNSTTVANLTMTDADWYMLTINNLGGWTGSSKGWGNGADILTPLLGSNYFYLMGEAEKLAGQLPPDCPPTHTCPQTTGQAVVDTFAQATAISGQNQTSGTTGETTISTGKSKAAVNLVNLINLSLLRSRWFMGSVNVMGNWSGDALFAYPDMTLAISGQGLEGVRPGDVVEYSLRYRNDGYDEADGVRVRLDLPEGLEMMDGGDASWSLGTIGALEEGTIHFRVKVNAAFQFEPQKRAGLPEIIPSARAAQDRLFADIVIKADISTTEPESRLGNNQTTAQLTVWGPEQEAEQTNQDNRQPELFIEAGHNVATYVYPGDTVTFQVKLRNPGQGRADNTTLMQKLFWGEEYVGSMTIEIGKVEADSGGTVNFGLTVPADAPAGTYRSEITAVADAPNGNRVSSNTAGLSFGVRNRVSLVMGEKSQAAHREPEVLGESTLACPPSVAERENLLPYALLLVTSSQLLVEKLKQIHLRKIYEKQAGGIDS